MAQNKTDMINDIKTNFENAIYGEIKSVVNVDRDELIKALEYDRHQYEKGFHDGVMYEREQSKIVQCKNCMHYCQEKHWCCYCDMYFDPDAHCGYGARKE